MWTVVCVYLYFRYGDKTPKSIPARCLGLLWMFIGIIMMSVFTATLVAAFGVEIQLQDNIEGMKVRCISE